MKTDSVFYRIFLEFPEVFFELLDLPADTARDYQFTSREIKQLSFRIDGLFLPSIENRDIPFYLVEVQFQPDDTFYSRLFGELFLYLRQYRIANPWRVVVIYPDRSVEREENRQFQELLNSDRVTRIYLNELESETSLGIGILRLIIESAETAETKARALVQQARERLTEARTRLNVIDLRDRSDRDDYRV